MHVLLRIGKARTQDRRHEAGQLHVYHLWSHLVELVVSHYGYQNTNKLLNIIRCHHVKR